MAEIIVATVVHHLQDGTKEDSKESRQVIPGSHVCREAEPDGKQSKVFGKEEEIVKENSVARSAILDVDIAEDGD